MQPQKLPADSSLFFLPSLAGGGAERVAVDLAKYFSLSDIDFLLMEKRIEYQTNRLIHHVGASPSDRTITRSEKIAGILSAVRDLHRMDDYASCLSFTTWPNLINVLARRPGRRVVLSEHSIASQSLSGWGQTAVRAMISTLYPHADQIIAVSSGVRQDLIRNFGIPPEKILIAYNPVNLRVVQQQSLKPIPKAFEWVFDRPVAIHVGRLAKVKGHHHLLRVFAMLASQTNARLLFLGDGPLLSTLIQQATKHHLRVAHLDEDNPDRQANVVFAGFQTNPYAWLRRASVCVLTSQREGCPLVLVEALQCSVPVISTDCPTGPREILAPGSIPSRKTTYPEEASHGILMPMFEEQCSMVSDALWVEQLKRLLTDQTLQKRYRAQGSKRAQDFAPANTLHHWSQATMLPLCY